jgi:O-antigen ligase
MKNSNETIAINAKRVWLFVYHINQDKSVGGRLEEYLFFIRNIIDIDALPGYGIKNYSHFFAGSTVMKLADVNPHSLIIEIILAFGIFGLFFLLIIGGIVTRAIWYVRKLNPNAASAFLVTAIYFVIATNIPSSAFRIPVLWFPLFFQFFLVLEQGGRS